MKSHLASTKLMNWPNVRTFNWKIVITESIRDSMFVSTVGSGCARVV